MKEKSFSIPIIIILISIFLIAIYLFCFYDYGTRPDNSRESFKDNIKSEIKSRLADELDPKTVFGSESANLAFLGLDKTEEREESLGCFRTDTIIIMHLDFVDDKVFMLSIPRDTYVFIPGVNKKDKINHAFPFGGGETGNGFANSISTIENFLGIEIDHYLGMDMEAIVPIVDTIGGIELNIDEYDQEHGSDLETGKQVLNGEQAFHYLHFRRSENGDIDRTMRQQKFMHTSLDEVSKKMSIKEGMQIYQDNKDMIYTDMNLKELTALAYYFRDLDRDDVNGYVVDGTFLNLNGISYWDPDLAEVSRIVAEMFLELP